MKFLVAFVCLSAAVALAAALPQLPQRYVPLLQRTEVHDDVGQYSLRYTVGDGTTVGEQGSLKPTNDGLALVLVKEGDYSWTAPNGQTFRTVYVADEYGYRPQGDHLPRSVVA